MRSLTLVAVTHQRTPFALLERLTLDADTADEVAFALGDVPGVEEAVVLATCNRTELYLYAAADVARAAIAILAAKTGVAEPTLRAVATVLTDDSASLHLFRVAAGLESRVIGEGEILGQVRAVASRLVDHPAGGPELAALFRWASATGRRARSRAGGPATPSLARTAIDAARALNEGDLTIVIGAGAMASAVTSELRARHLRYRVAARRPDRAARLTRRPQDVISLDQLEDHLGEAALVVCTTSARRPILHRATLASSRPSVGRPMTVIDLSMPRNVETTVGDLDGVRLIHLDQLSGGGGDLHARRAREAVAAEHERYRLWLGGRSVGSLIAALRERVSAICLEEANRHLPPDDAARVARRLSGRVSHRITALAKEFASEGNTEALCCLARVVGVDERLAPGNRRAVGVAS